MKIGIIALSLNKNAKPGYYNSQELGMGKALAAQGHSVTVYKLVEKAKLPAPTTEKITPSLLYTNLPAFSLGMNGFFKKSHILPDMDVLICFCDTQLYTRSVAAWCRHRGIRMIPYIGVIESTSVSSSKRRIRNLLLKPLLRFYQNQTVVWGKTPAVCTKLNQLGIRHTSLVPVGLDTELLNADYINVSKEELREKWGYRSSEKVLLFIGRLTAEKEPLEMLKIFERLYDQDNSYRLCMVGKGELKEAVDAYIERNDLAVAVKLIPTLPNDRMWELYRISHCFINLNRHEIYGMAILEALYYECPVIAFHAPGPDFILSSVQAPSLYLTDSEDALLQTVRLFNKVEFLVQTERIHQAVLEMFIWERIMEEQLPLFES